MDKKTKIIIAIFVLVALTGGFDTIMAIGAKALVLLLLIIGVKAIIESFKKE